MWLKAKHDSGKTVVWADGYLPPLEKMRQIKRQIVKKKPILMGLYLNFPLIPEDRIFEELIGAMREDLHKNTKSMEPYHFFVMRFKDLETPSELYLPLHREYFHEPESKRYRVMIAACNKHPPGEKNVKRLLEKSGFEVKQPGDYENYRAFREYGSVILQEILKIYTAPHVVSMKKLNGLGFSVQLHVL